MNRFTLGAMVLSVAVLGGTAVAFEPQQATATSQTNSDQPVTDTWITTKVKTDLIATKGVPGTDIEVDTKDGVVTLTGSVATEAERSKAATVAKGIKGVKKVDDQLQVAKKKAG